MVQATALAAITLDMHDDSNHAQTDRPATTSAIGNDQPGGAHNARWFVGCMTGTSLDGLDAALVRIVGHGQAMRCELACHLAFGLPDDLTDALATIMRDEPVPPIHVMRTARHLGVVHAQAVDALLSRSPIPREHIEAVVCHGQTVWHAPDDRLSWQLMDPWPIVRALRLPVCYDLRQADLIAGGQGAPITPMADRVMFGEAGERVLVANLGGICNVTAIGGDLRGEDLGPCNLLLDGIVQRLAPPKRYDEDGTLAAAGSVNANLLAAMGEHPWFDKPEPRTAGREDFNEAWIDTLLTAHDVTAADACGTAAAFVANLITSFADGRGFDTLVLAGGGVLNRTLVDQITDAAGAYVGTVVTSDVLGVPAQAREAMAMAVLGAMTCDGQAITAPTITGADAPGRAGVWALP